jgi:hypothetical protein
LLRRVYGNPEEIAENRDDDHYGGTQARRAEASQSRCAFDEEAQPGGVAAGSLPLVRASRLNLRPAVVSMTAGFFFARVIGLAGAAGGVI